MRLPSALVGLCACAWAACAAPAAPEPAPSAARPVPPPSALTALVRVLEVLDGVRPPGTAVHVRAVEGDALYDPGLGEEYVRVVLDLTVFARDLDQAYAAFADFRRALDAEGAARERPERASEARVARVFREFDWSPDPGAAGAAFDELVSVSDTVRVAVRPGRPGPPELEPEVASSEPGVGLEDYVRRIAAESFEPEPTLALHRRVERPRPGTLEAHLRIEPVDAEPGWDRLRLGSFLRELEAKSPALRVARFAFHPAQPGSNLEDRWTFEAEAVLRAPEGATRRS